MEFTSDKMVLFLVVIVPLMFAAAAIIMNAGVCLIIPLLTWVGIAILMLYFPTTTED